MVSPVIVDSGLGTVTLVESTTFCISNGLGDIRCDTPHGLFHCDSRVLSRWELEVDGRPLEQLAVRSSEPFKARFVLRRPPAPGLADSTVLVERRRLIGDGLTEVLTVWNFGQEDTVLDLALHVESDFADLFAVKEGRWGPSQGEATVEADDLVLTDQRQPGRGLTVSATAEPSVASDGLCWQVLVPAGKHWQTQLFAQPIDCYRRSPALSLDTEDSPAHRIRAWRNSATRLTSSAPILNHVLQRSETDLGSLRIDDVTDEDSPAYVAAGAPWFMTLFGRDSLLTSWMALPLDRGLAVGTLRELSRTQGRQTNPLTEEQPGRIMHEIRHGPAGGPTSAGTVYYGTVDATPLFVMLLAECWRWGTDATFIEELLPAADAALDWIERDGDLDGDGFVEYRRKTDRGLANQGWKDSFDAINDAEGNLADPAIALAEVQGYVYAARLARAELAEAFGDAETAGRMRRAAEELARRFDEAFWDDENSCYAIALDHNKHRVDAVTSNAAQCLWTGIVHEQRAEKLVTQLADPSMNSGFGLRTLASTMGAYNPMSYHNGSIWPHDTAIAVAGLQRYRNVPGAGALAEELTTGLLDAAAEFSGRLPELFCGFARSQFRFPVGYPTSCSPQAWASAAPLLLVRSALGLDPMVPQRRLTLTPRIPAAWGTVELTDLRLGPATVTITAERDTAQVRGLPDDWRLQIN
ncbi:glycogen debranching enzyme [Nocardia tenerifensis]|uniref:Glycogen debranching enzyme n=2 Tax=Nocardia tenerifensis TaxID=228006 RepID=A0A318KHC0_9NOCA|nr:glycogen debranching N-terminal domain-containing protein [Nocardia tenerifensis]PXX59792.1 glycogen debranching enzyme [Nocardia tenerifensis]